MQYRNLSGYNRIRILAKIEEILTKEGAQILRTHFDKPVDIKCISAFDTVANIRKQIEQLPLITAPGESLHLNFLLKEYFYSFSFDSNPFFPTLYKKVKVDKDGNYVGKRLLYTTGDNCADTISCSLAFDEIYQVLTQEDIDELAESWYDSVKSYLESGEENEPEVHRIKVANTYNSKSHWETYPDNTKCCIWYVAIRLHGHDYIEKEV